MRGVVHSAQRDLAYWRDWDEGVPLIIQISLPIWRALRNLSAALAVNGGLILIPGWTSSSIFLSKGKGFPKTA